MTDITIYQPGDYDNRLALAGQVANEYAQSDTFSEACSTWTANTQRRYSNDLEWFSEYLASAGIVRPAEALFSDAQAWRGMTYGLLQGFKAWLEQAGYAISTIKGAICTIHVFCKLAGPPPGGAGVLDELLVAAVSSVRGAAGRKARNLDAQRSQAGIPTRRGHKKAVATKLSTSEALQLKKTTTQPYRRFSRDRDIASRDALLMGLLVEHALRCSEVALLTVESIDLARNTVTIYRPKTDRTDIQRLHKHTRLAAGTYLAQIGRKSGPLFTGYNGQGLTTRAINRRVEVLGGEIGVEHLSPHDLRHHWAFDVLMNGTALNIVQADGGWETESMPLKYAKRSAIGGSALISEELD